MIIRLPTQKFLQLDWRQTTQNLSFTCPKNIYSNCMTIVYIHVFHRCLVLKIWILESPRSKMKWCPSDGVTSLVELVEYKT